MRAFLLTLALAVPAAVGHAQQRLNLSQCSAPPICLQFQVPTLQASGSVTAPTYYGDGSHLTGVGGGGGASTVTVAAPLTGDGSTGFPITLPTALAYSNADNNWSAAQTSQSSWTFNNGFIVPTRDHVGIGLASPTGILSVNASQHGLGVPSFIITQSEYGDTIMSVQSKGRTHLNSYDDYNGAGPAVSIDQYGTNAGTGLTVTQHGMGGGSGVGLYVNQLNTVNAAIETSTGVIVDAGGVTAPWFAGDGSALTNLPAGPPPAGIVFDDPNQAEYVGTGINPVGTGNAAFGFDAMNSNTASFNTAYGQTAMFSQVTGAGNVAMGAAALYADTLNSSNTVVGFRAAHDLVDTNSDENTIIGAYAMEQVPSGFSYTAQNVAIGYGSRQFARGYQDMAVGAYSGQFDSGNNNTFLGTLAGQEEVDGSGNIFIGSGAGQSQQHVAGAIIIGVSASIPDGNNNELYIGNTIFGDLGAQTVGIAVTPGAGTEIYVCSGGTNDGMVLFGGTGAMQTACTDGAGALVNKQLFLKP